MLYHRRIKAERRLAGTIGRLRSARVAQLLSTNRKTGASINLPVTNCRPTPRCAAACYACEGPIAWTNSVRKSLVLDAMLRTGDIAALARECRCRRDVRLNGSGDMTLVHVPALVMLAEACPRTVFWGFTRRREVAETINGQRGNLSLIVTFDATTPRGALDGYEGPLAFGPRGPSDAVPADRRIVVVFPEHHAGRTVQGVPLHELDCPATRGAERVLACRRCRRCWKPFEFVRR
ncbi:MAG TPA: hypothetical protein VFH61_02310 [Thermoleophilia bacterium]|nr:hypothetical protein [Thermoleophilia bacterium]